MATLGCGRTAVRIVEAGGGPDVTPYVPWTGASWSRTADDTSDASVNLDGLDGRCRSVLETVDPWRHDLVISRDDRDVWAGPIVTPGPRRAFAARDVTAWWDRRPILRDMTFLQEDLGDVFRAVAEAAMASDRRPGVEITHERVGVKGDRTIVAGQHRYAGLELRELARTAVSWTTIGRTVIVTRKRTRPDIEQPVALLEDLDFATPPDVSKSGLAQATTVGIRGGGSVVTPNASDPVYAEATDAAAAARYGFIYRVFTEESILDYGSALAAARARLAQLAYPPVVLTGAALASTARVDIDDLIPGRLIDIRLTETAIPFEARMRLTKVNASATAQGMESISIDVESLVAIEEE